MMVVGEKSSKSLVDGIAITKKVLDESHFENDQDYDVKDDVEKSININDKSNTRMLLLQSENESLRDKLFDLQSLYSEALLKISELKGCVSSDSRKFMSESLSNFSDIKNLLESLGEDNVAEGEKLKSNLRASRKLLETKRREWDRKEKDLLLQIKEQKAVVLKISQKLTESEKVNKDREAKIAQLKSKMGSLQSDLETLRLHQMPEKDAEIAKLGSQISINEDCLLALTREVEEKDKQLAIFEEALADLKQSHNLMCRDSEDRWSELNDVIGTKDEELSVLKTENNHLKAQAEMLSAKITDLTGLKLAYSESCEKLSSQDKAYESLKIELQEAIKLSKRKPSTVTIGSQTQNSVSLDDAETQTISHSLTFEHKSTQFEVLPIDRFDKATAMDEFEPELMSFRVFSEGNTMNLLDAHIDSFLGREY